MATFRLLHISDLHFSVQPRRLDAFARVRRGFQEQQVLRALFQIRLSGLYSSHDQDLARAVAEFALYNRHILDGIVITGDLATTGLLDDLSAALSYIEEPASIGVSTIGRTPTLAAAGLNLCLLPGNHDRYSSELGAPGGTEFDRLFSKYWETGSRIESVIFEREGGKLAIVCADFSLMDANHVDRRRLIGRFGQGRVYNNVLSDLEAETNELRAAHSPIGIIWAVHFPPKSPRNEWLLRLIRGQKLVSSARMHGIHHIIAGHIHSDLTYAAGARPAVAVYCAHSACSMSFDGGNGFQVLQIDVAGSHVAISEEAYEWNDDEGDFLRL
jgi:3',5'-cyclic AMP phosphodiesterase CpdA